ncbi:small secreted hydrophilic protein [Streptomyces rubrogriseus]|uniref:Small secreted hydrophilic protein n=1 Tax=Streptomyces rubrogriseus TaxID=194673 RepID=A0A6G3TGG6_9ACTN|nr:small secreted hydrophilic protein [Streptomyces rubrogriseus]NEC35398.1 small secreted hydrophilic protein [Streptomyces rubrogriseus]
MVFSRRMAALAAVVLIPLGIAATSFALTDSPQEPKVPAKVELESGSPTPAPTASSPEPTPSDQVVTRPPVTDGPSDDDDDDDRGGRDAGEPADSADDAAGDDGPGDG